MPDPLPLVYLVRHAETAWSLSGQHTGLTDLPLTPSGELQARALGNRLQPLAVDTVLASPLERARRTCDLAGYAASAQTDPDLVEWNYGQYEGLRTPEILALNPTWDIFRDGCPGGESPLDVAARAARVLARVRAIPGNTLIFSSGHFLRAFTACWLGLPLSGGRGFLLGTASVSALTYDHSLSEPAIRLWNDAHHLEPAS